MSIGENIRLARKDKSISMKTLGSKLGITEQAISQYERGLRIPNTKLIFKIAEILDVKPSELDPELIKWDKEMPRIQKELKLVEAIDLILKERGHKVSDFSEDEYEKIEKSIIEYLDTIAYMKK